MTHTSTQRGCASPGKQAGGSAPNARTGFTLIELLAVVAVIAVLAAMLLPTLSRAKGAVRQVWCVSNLRQLALAGQLYWDDNAGSAFRWRAGATNGGQIYWFGWIQDGAEGQREFDVKRGALYPYLGGRGVEVCPAFNYTALELKAKATGASYGYGYNLALSSAAHDPPVNVAKIHSPSRTVFLADSAQVNTFQPPASPEHPMLEEFYYVNTTEPTVHFRHAGRASAAFCDGHVGPELPLPGSLDTRLAKHIIGRLRPEVLSLE